MHLEPVAETAEDRALRAAVRGFLDGEAQRPDRHVGLGMAAGHDPEFSHRLAQRGWVGMGIPTEYGGAGYTAVQRFVVVEELLAAGVPLSAHWIADRQIAASLLRYGTPEQKRRFLPAIASGDCFFSIGMSESEAGSDLAGIRTTARPDGTGWRLSGAKIWTSFAHLNHYVLVLARVHGTTRADRSLMQLIVDLHSPGVQTDPIPLLTGEHHFNTLTLDDVFVPADMVLGRPGDGWEQVTNELVSERAGPDRFLSVLGLLGMFVESAHGCADPRTAEDVGRLVATYWAVRQMSLSVARLVDDGQVPGLQAAMAKDLGATLEQDTVAVVRRRSATHPVTQADPAFAELLREAVLMAPSFTIRGGTSEILRSVISRRLDQLPGPKATRGESASDTPLRREVAGVLDRWFPTPAPAGADEQWNPAAWAELTDLGYPAVSVPAAAGGSGGTLCDAIDVLLEVGRAAAGVPLAESALLGGWLIASAGLSLPLGPLAVGAPAPGEVRLSRRGDDWILNGVLRSCAWSPIAAWLVLLLPNPDHETRPSFLVAVVPAAHLRVSPMRNLADEPGGAVHFDDVTVPSSQVGAAEEGVNHDTLLSRGALARAAMIAGALVRIREMTVEYAGVRSQFGQPIDRFQAVAQSLALLAEQSECTELAVRAAARMFTDSPLRAAALAKIRAGAAADSVAARAHQIHAAIGMTKEYPLHRFTRRLYAWSAEYGTESYWSERIGRETLAAGRQELWPQMTVGARS
jgi:alkylation response protein AidB-like acyl-CoA dehydrogenase